MRTTVRIDEALLREARGLAAATGRTLGDVIDDALRILLGRTAHETSGVALPTFGGSGLRPGVDLEDQDAMVDLLDADRTRAL